MYAVWFVMVPGDRRDRWPDDLLTDPRVIHLWDEGRVTGRYFGEHVTRQERGVVEWDAWVLYSPESIWAVDATPTRQLGWGRTIVETREELRELLARPGGGPPEREP